MVHTRSCMRIPFQALSIILLASVHVFAASLTPPGYRFELTHVDAKHGFTKDELLRRAVNRSRLEVTALSATLFDAGSVPFTPQSCIKSKIDYVDREYHMELRIGTLREAKIKAIADTGSDRTWVRTEWCSDQGSSSMSHVPCSSTMCNLPAECSSCQDLCMFKISYADESKVSGYVITNTLTFDTPNQGPASFPNVAIGCAIDVSCGPKSSCAVHKASGIVGLGRSEQSLVKQLGFDKFSYCLTDLHNQNPSSPILFGPLAVLPTTPENVVQSMPLMATPDQGLWSKYWVQLESISIGDKTIPIPQPDSHGTGNMFVDSGATFTYLPRKPYMELRNQITKVLDEFKKNPYPEEESVCYKTSPSEPQPHMPEIKLNFAGGAKMVLQGDNYMIFGESTCCLAMKPMEPPRVKGTPISVLGNFQQHNIHMLYDLAEERLSFVPAKCDKV